MGVRRLCGRTSVSGESGTVVYEPVTIITVTGGHTLHVLWNFIKMLHWTVHKGYGVR